MASETDQVPNQENNSAVSDEPIALYTVVLLFGPAVGILLGGPGGGGMALLIGLLCVLIIHLTEPDLATQLNERAAEELEELGIRDSG